MSGASRAVSSVFGSNFFAVAWATALSNQPSMPVSSFLISEMIAWGVMRSCVPHRPLLAGRLRVRVVRLLQVVDVERSGTVDLDDRLALGLGGVVLLAGQEVIRALIEIVRVERHRVAGVEHERSGDH